MCTRLDTISQRDGQRDGRYSACRSVIKNLMVNLLNKMTLTRTIIGYLMNIILTQPSSVMARDLFLRSMVTAATSLGSGPGQLAHACNNNNNNNNNAIYIAQICTQQQMGCRMISVQTERLSA